MFRKLHVISIMTLYITNSYSQTLSSLNNLQTRHSFIGDQELQNKLTVPSGIAAGVAATAAPDVEIRNWLDAVAYAGDHIEELAKELSVVKSSVLVIPSITHTNSVIRNISYIILAMKPQAEINTYFSNNSITGDKGRQIELIIKDIRKIVSGLGAPTVSVFATGDVAGSISRENSGTGAQNTIGTGSVGVEYTDNENKILARIFVASSIDTVKSGFGQSLLNPARGKAGSAIIEWYKRLHICQARSLWVHAYGSFANATWGVDTLSENPIYRPASILGAGALLNWDIFKGQIASTNVGLNLEAGVGLRYLGGDIRGLLKGGSDSAAFIRAFSTGKSTFIGPEAGMSINVGPIIAALQAYYLIKGKNDQVNGLTRLQFSFGISINASVIAGSLN